jgi:hypothetical protein
VIRSAATVAHMKKHHVRIDDHHDGRMIVEVDGVDIAGDTAGFFLAAEAGATPTLTLVMRPGVEFDGVALVQAEVPADFAEIVQTAIASLDAEQIGERALDGLGWGGEPGSSTQAIIDEIGRQLAVLLS